MGLRPKTVLIHSKYEIDLRFLHHFPSGSKEVQF